MTRDDIIRMREQADDLAVQHLQCVGEYHPDFHTVSDERFAALVVAALRDEMWEKAMKLVAEAGAAEREACAQIVEAEAMQYAEPVWAVEIINDIRARGQA